jgi:hypothetical protein
MMLTPRRLQRRSKQAVGFGSSQRFPNQPLVSAKTEGQEVCKPFLKIDQLVIARKRPFVVTEISPEAHGIGNDSLRRHHLIKLSSVEDDGLSEQLEVNWELEPGTTVYERPSLTAPSTFDQLTAKTTGAIKPSE